MKDYLQDIVKHTHALGFIDLVKVTGTPVGLRCSPPQTEFLGSQAEPEPTMGHWGRQFSYAQQMALALSGGNLWRPDGLERVAPV